MSSTTLRTLHPSERDAFAVDAETGCWVWTRGLNAAGYPWAYAHRRFYTKLVGPIPDGYHVHHVCRNTACVNPEHLEPVAPVEHFREHFLHGKAGITLDDVRTIRELGRQGARAIDVAKRFDITYDTVYCYWRGVRWNALLGDDAGPATYERICARAGCEKPVIAKYRNKKWCSHWLLNC